ncbi:MULTISPECIES: helix-turn-helix domain-containing protein [unclassified Luteibacter]|uniref:helix-turn-helix domain-containing protein n=1 Tax=Luteibacter sp. PvP019 TaxID=3156436 RepID=UPI003399514A
MNVGQAIRMCRRQRGASQNAIAIRAQCSVSYLSMLENNKRDPTLSTVKKIAEALHVPIGVLFVLAADRNDLGAMDGRMAEQLMQSARASLEPPTHMAARTGEHHG